MCGWTKPPNWCEAEFVHLRDFYGEGQSSKTWQCPGERNLWVLICLEGTLCSWVFPQKTRFFVSFLGVGGSCCFGTYHFSFPSSFLCWRPRSLLWLALSPRFRLAVQPSNRTLPSGNTLDVPTVNGTCGSLDLALLSSSFAALFSHGVGPQWYSFAEVSTLSASAQLETPKQTSCKPYIYKPLRTSTKLGPTPGYAILFKNKSNCVSWVPQQNGVVSKGNQKESNTI